MTPAPDGPSAGELSAEDAKLVLLARAARARARAPEGAAVRDDLGRTYAAASVGMAALRLSAVQAAVAAALSSGSDRFEAVVVCSEQTGLDEDDLALVSEVGAPPVVVVDPDGAVVLTR